MMQNVLMIVALSLYTYSAGALINSLLLAANAMKTDRPYTFSVVLPLVATIVGHVCLVLS